MEDLVDDILTRLPVKSLLRYKCVCKRWYDLISSNAFVKQHLSRSILSNTNNRVLISKKCLNLYSLPINSLNQSHPELLVRPMPATSFDLLGSSNGLLCLCLWKVIIIWNPTTRKHINVPALDDVDKFEDGTRHQLVRGFGYDSVSDDYKLVRVFEYVSSYGETLSVRVKTNIYSLRSHSWRKSIHIPDYMICGLSFGIFTCGAIHWVAQRKPRVGFQASPILFVISFDLATEEYMEITLPKCVNNDKITTFLIREFGGCLSMVGKVSNRHNIYVWVMNEYGITESWTQLLNISSSEIGRSVCYLVEPLIYSECGDEVLLSVNSFEKLIWYNIKNRIVKFVDIRGLPTYSHPLICLESLVSLGGRAENDERRGGEEEKEASVEEEQTNLSAN